MTVRILFQGTGVMLVSDGPAKSPSIILTVFTPDDDMTYVTLNRKSIEGLKVALTELSPPSPLWAVPYEDPPEGYWVLEVRAESARAAERIARAYLRKEFGRRRFHIARDRIRETQKQGDVAERGEEIDYVG